jgi:hypothetical protein
MYHRGRGFMKIEDFIWDNNKNEANIQKHGVSFYEAWTVFDDEFVVYLADEKHSQDEERFIVIGESMLKNLLIVCHCYRDDDGIVRLISARKAKKEEINYYYGGVI